MPMLSSPLWLGPSWLDEDTERILLATLRRTGGKLFSDQLYHVYCRHPWLKSCIGSLEKYVSRTSAFVYHKRTDSERPYIVLRSEEVPEMLDGCEDKSSAHVGKGERKLLRRYMQRQFCRDTAKGQNDTSDHRLCVEEEAATSQKFCVQRNLRESRPVVCGKEDATKKTARVKWWQKLDNEFGKAELDSLQESVLVNSSRRSWEKSTPCRVQKNKKPSRRQRVRSAVVDEELPASVKRAYASRRAQ